MFHCFAGVYREWSLILLIKKIFLKRSKFFLSIILWFIFLLSNHFTVVYNVFHIFIFNIFVFTVYIVVRSVLDDNNDCYNDAVAQHSLHSAGKG